MGNAGRQVPLYQELAAAMPLVLQNLTNYSGLINDRAAPPNPNITYHFGDLNRALALLSDKVSGFYMVLYDMIRDGTGPSLCPMDKQSHIKECLLLATCLLEEHVPEDIELPMFQSYMEMTQRFLDISWPVLKKGLLFEEPTPILHQDDVAPKKYQCDLLKHQTISPGGALLQESSTGRAALLSSNRVIQASQASHEILDQHAKVGSSSDSHVDATILKLHRLWRPVCQQLGCDHSNFWDVQLASYGQTTALLQVQSGFAARRAARTEIQQRTRLKMRMVQFVDENAQYFGRILNSSSPGRRFFDSSFIQASSRAAFQRFAHEGREAMMRTIMPFMENIATENETRAINLLDQVEFRKFQQRKQQRLMGGSEERGSFEEEHADEESEEERVQEEEDDNEENKQEEEDEEDGYDQDVEDEEDQDGQLTDANMTASEVQNPPNSRHRALLSMDMDLVEAEDESLDGKRRRRRRRSRRRRFIGGRRRRRRRRRLFKKIVKAVKRAVEDIVEFMAEGLGCVGIAVEFASTGYTYNLNGAIGLGIGLTAGASQSLDQLLRKQMPSTTISLDFGFAVGTAAKWVWTGAGLGGSVVCDHSGCDAYLTVASFASVNLEIAAHPACPFGATLGAATCGQCFGFGISVMCCDMNLATGSNDCR